MRGMLEPLAFSALLYFNYEAYHYGFAVGQKLQLSEMTALFMGGLCVVVANVLGGALTLAARAVEKIGR